MISPMIPVFPSEIEGDTYRIVRVDVDTIQGAALCSQSIPKIANDLRDEDKHEVLLSYETGMQAITHSLVNSTASYLIYDMDGNIAAVCGWAVLASSVDGYGHGMLPIMQWFLSTKYFPKIGRAISRYLKDFMDYHLGEGNLYYNYVPKSYTTAIRWLEFLGFERQECQDNRFFLMIKGQDKWAHLLRL